MFKIVQVVVVFNIVNCCLQCIVILLKFGFKWSIYDFLDELGFKFFSGLLEIIGFMYMLFENVLGL